MAAVESIPRFYCPTSYYELFTRLLAAVDAGASMALVNDAYSEHEIERLKASVPDWDVPQPVGDRSRTGEPSTILLPGYQSDARIGIFTSGTTGSPTLHYHRLETLARQVRVSEKHQSDMWGFAYHPTHFAGLQVFLQAVANRNPIIRLFGLEDDHMHAAIDEHQITHLSATPTFIKLLVSSGYVHPIVKRITTGGERSHAGIVEGIRRTFPNAKYTNIYASTEAGSLLVCDGELFRVPVGLEGKVMVVDGQLTVHRSLLADSLASSVADDFYPTGDQVEVVARQPLTIRFLARDDDMINVAGYKVNPHEVEQRLAQLPGVREVCVYGRANSVTGNLVCADVVPLSGSQLTVREIRQTLEADLAAYKIPRVIRFVEQIDTTYSGKKRRLASPSQS